MKLCRSRNTSARGLLTTLLSLAIRIRPDSVRCPVNINSKKSCESHDLQYASEQKESLP